MTVATSCINLVRFGAVIQEKLVLILYMCEEKDCKNGRTSMLRMKRCLTRLSRTLDLASSSDAARRGSVWSVNICHSVKSVVLIL